MARKHTLAYGNTVAAPADKPDSVAPASGIRLVRPPLGTLPGASSLPPPPSQRAVSVRPPAVRPTARTLPLAAGAPALRIASKVVPNTPVPNKPAPSKPVASKPAPIAIATKPTLVSAPAMFGAPRTMVPPPPPSGPRARGLSSAPPPPSKRPLRAEPELLDEDSFVCDDVETAIEAPRRRSSAPPRNLPSLQATGQNWPRVEWPRLDTAETPLPALAEQIAMATPMATIATATSDVFVEAPPLMPREMQMVPPPPCAEPIDVTATTSHAGQQSRVYSDDDVIDFAVVSPLARLRAAAAQVGPIVSWLDHNPRAFASVGFGAGVVVALFVALFVQ